MKLKKLLSVFATFAVVFSTVAGVELSASAATQVGETYNYTGTENSASANDNSKISPYLDEKWTIPITNTRGIMTSQNTKINDGKIDDGGNFGKCFTGAGNHYSFRSGLDDKIVYYTFDLMANDGGFGSVAINGHRLDGNSYTTNSKTYAGVKISNANNVKYNPHRITVIADTLNNKAYYYSTAQTGEKGGANITLGSEATQLDIGNRYDNNNNRYFFKNFEYGKIEYEINGADTVTAGESAEYTMQETGTSLGVNYEPEKTSYALEMAVEGVTLADNTLTVANTVADSTEVTINARINGTKVASKIVTVSNPVSDEDIISINGADAYIGEDGKGNIRFVTTVNSNETVSEYGTWIASVNISGAELVENNQHKNLKGEKNGEVKTTFSADLVNIESGKFTSPFYAISYIKIGGKTSWSNIKSAKVNDYAQAN